MNVFEDFVEESEFVNERMTWMSARDKQANAAESLFHADINVLREEVTTMRVAFNDLQQRYSPLVSNIRWRMNDPSGWHFYQDFNKWLGRKKCVGFKRGENESHLVGGDCNTIAELVQQLDRLYAYIFSEESD